MFEKSEQLLNFGIFWIQKSNHVLCWGDNNETTKDLKIRNKETESWKMGIQGIFGKKFEIFKSL